MVAPLELALRVKRVGEDLAKKYAEVSVEAVEAVKAGAGTQDPYKGMVPSVGPGSRW